MKLVKFPKFKGGVNLKRKTKNGFTLIELIVVVSIVLILSSLLVPKILGYQDKARKAKVVNTSRQIFDATMESYTEQEGKLDEPNLTNSIKSVTDAKIAETDGVKVSNGTATVNFSSDKKNYSVVVTPSTNDFTVKDEAGGEVYKNKE